MQNIQVQLRSQGQYRFKTQSNIVVHRGGTGSAGFLGSGRSSSNYYSSNSSDDYSQNEDNYSYYSENDKNYDYDSYQEEEDHDTDFPGVMINNEKRQGLQITIAPSGGIGNQVKKRALSTDNIGKGLLNERHTPLSIIIPKSAQKEVERERTQTPPPEATFLNMRSLTTSASVDMDLNRTQVSSSIITEDNEDDTLNNIMSSLTNIGNMLENRVVAQKQNEHNMGLRDRKTSDFTQVYVSASNRNYSSLPIGNKSPSKLRPNTLADDTWDNMDVRLPNKNNSAELRYTRKKENNPLNQNEKFKVEKKSTSLGSEMHVRKEKDDHGNETQKKFITIHHGHNFKDESRTIQVVKHTRKLPRQNVTTHCYTFEQMKSIRDEVRKGNYNNIRPNYLIGFNILKELCNEEFNAEPTAAHKPNTSQPVPIMKRQKKIQKDDPTIQQDTRVPQSLSRNRSTQNDDKDEPFRMQINQSFNRLTEDTIIRTNEDMTNLLKNSNLIQYAIGRFCEKISMEQAFSSLYAKYICQCPVQSFKDEVLRISKERFFSTITMKSNKHNQMQLDEAKNLSSFIGSLIKDNYMQESEGIKAVDMLIDALIRDNAPSIFFEIFNKFMISCGTSFIAKLPEQNWETLGKIMANDSVKSIMKYLISEILEMREETKKVQQENEVFVVSEPKETNISLIKAYFDDFLNNDVITDAEMNVPDFLCASLQLISEYHHKLYTFSLFVSKVLIKKKAFVEDCLNVFQFMIKNFKENGMISDCPIIWACVSDLSLLMFFKGILTLVQLEEIHRDISSDPWDCIQDIKWYLIDNYDFSESLQTPGLTDKEIEVAIKMPKILNSHKIEIPFISRIISISIIRAIFTKQMKDKKPKLEQISDAYKKVISMSLEKQRETTLHEMEYYLYQFNFFQFSLDVFISFFE